MNKPNKSWFYKSTYWHGINLAELLSNIGVELYIGEAFDTVASCLKMNK